uniref:Uncharacterized protein n=1 Tax=Talaromyces marneffei PM1 TaxID=1077442 RepID=A0A093V3B6_TALMA
MEWKEAPEGRWRKDLGGAEKIYRFTSTIFKLTGREHWGLYTVCQVKFGPGLDPEEEATAALRNAWKALRFEFPALTLIPDGYEAVYPSGSDEEKISAENALEDWAQKTFRVAPLLSVKEILADYKLHDLPELIWLPATSQVVLLISHWRCDGLGTCMLLNRLFQLVSTKASGAVPEGWTVEKDLANISPSIEDAAGAPMVSNPEIEETARDMSKFREKTMNTIGVPYNGDRTTPPGQTAVQVTTFTAESTKTLVDECRARKITVAAAIHAALATAAFELTSAKEVNDYITVMAVSFRPYLQNPYNTVAHACRTYVTGIAPEVSKNASFEEQTTTLTKLFKNWHTDKMSQALRELYRGASQALLSPRSRPAGPPPNPPSGITHSNLGVVDHFIKSKYYGDHQDKTFEALPIIEVTGFEFGVTVLTRQMMFYPWTFRGQLNFSINYNDAYYDTEAPQKLIRERASFNQFVPESPEKYRETAVTTFHSDVL